MMEMYSQLLYKFFQGTASEKEVRDIRAWLEKDPGNNQVLMRERKLFDAMTLLKSQNEIMAERKRRNILLRPGFRKAIGMAAVIAVAFGAGWFLTSRLSSVLNPQMHTINVPAGQRINLVLPDGSAVWLNGRTTLEYPGSFSGHFREVRLDGQAYFEVAHNKSKPFIVRTDQARVEVLGTKFDIKAHKVGGGFETVLMEGRVKVQLEGDPRMTVTLTPDMKASLSNGKLIRTYVRDYNPYRWKDGLICFTNASFEDIIHELEQNYDIKVIIEKQDIPDFSYSGKFRINDGIDYALRVLRKDVDFDFERSDDHNVIYIK